VKRIDEKEKEKYRDKTPNRKNA